MPAPARGHVGEPDRIGRARGSENSGPEGVNRAAVARKEATIIKTPAIADVRKAVPLKDTRTARSSKRERKKERGLARRPRAEHDARGDPSRRADGLLPGKAPFIGLVDGSEAVCLELEPRPADRLNLAMARNGDRVRSLSDTRRRLAKRT